MSKLYEIEGVKFTEEWISDEHKLITSYSKDGSVLAEETACVGKSAGSHSDDNLHNALIRASWKAGIFQNEVQK